MKNYKIKIKDKSKGPRVFIMNTRGPLPHPKIPFWFFNKIHKPILNKDFIFNEANDLR